MIKRYIKEWLFNVIAWVAITNLYALAILTNMRFIFKIAKVEDIINSNELASYFTSNYQYFEATLFGVTFGSLFYLFNHLLDRLVARKMPFGKIILLKTFLYILAIYLVFSTMGFIFDIIPFYPIDVDQVFMENRKVLDPIIFISFFTFILFTSVLINFLIQVSYKFGPKILIPMFVGKYHNPKSENRIFLFLDLKNSTGIAEELGHIKYSELLQDCYFDLNKIVFKCNAEIYQYVGDEVVLTWENKKKNLGNHAIKATFRFRDLLIKRKNYYLNKYGVLPEFKGGLNLGNVSVAEIGEIKRDIAYHGDVVNTASRLQEAAKIHEKNLMVSENVIRELGENHNLYIEEMPTIILKGKKKKVSVFWIEEAVNINQAEASIV